MTRKFTLIFLGLVTALLFPLALWLQTAAVPGRPVPPEFPRGTAGLLDPALPVTSTVGTTLYLPAAMYKANAADTHPFGIAMYGSIDGPAGLPQMQAAGASRVTTILQWSAIEPTPGGGYNWSAYDAKLSSAAAAGMSIHVLFDDNPAWASLTPRGPVSPTFAINFQDVVSATVHRYNGTGGLPRVDAWSFYGEPDNEFAWGFQGAAYANMLAQIAPIVHAANPEAKVVLGGLAYDCFVDVTNERCTTRRWVLSFLPDTLNQLNAYPGGAAAYIDAVAFNFYPISLWRWPTIREKAQSIRAVMSRYGVGQLPLIVPEMSMWSMWQGNLETQGQQADWLVLFYVRGLSAGIQQMYWFQVFDLVPVSAGSAQGLFRNTDLAQPKQAYFAYKVLAHQLAGFSFQRSLNLANAEGYVFSSGALQQSIVWGLQSASATPVNFAQACARRVDMLGTVTQITDGGPGDLDVVRNGNIRLSVGFEQPIYVEAC